MTNHPSQQKPDLTEPTRKDKLRKVWRRVLALTKDGVGETAVSVPFISEHWTPTERATS